MKLEYVNGSRRRAGCRKVRAGFPMILTGLLLGTGCGHQAARRMRADRFLTEESRALTSAVVETLSEQPTERRDAYTATALLLARQDQRLEGLPLEPIQVEPLISSNRTALAALTNRFQEQNRVLGVRENAGEHLLALGELKEKEINQQRVRWFKWGSSLTILVGGFVALCVFCPIALPLIGRFLGWIVGKLPGWAGAIGVVSTKAFDAVVRGVEKTKRNAANSAEGAGAMQDLEANLATELDADHKILVHNRRQAQPI